MPYVTAPDINYVMESSFELLEQTPDVHFAAYHAGMNLVSYFDMYDAHYSREGACSSIKNLCTMMHSWIDQQDELTRGVILSANVYSAGHQLSDMIKGVTNNLIENYMRNNGREYVDPLGFYNHMYLEDRNRVNIVSESDIVFPANIATSIMQDKRMFEYITMLKQQLVKSLSIDIPINALQEHYVKMVVEAQKRNSFALTRQSVIESPLQKTKKQKIDLQDKARRALKKGVRKFTNLFGSNDIKSFINGEGFVAEGKKYNWQFRPKSTVSMLEMTHSPMSGHIPYSLSLLNKNGDFIGDCCVYVLNNTPIVDQIITIMLYIQHDEDDLIKNCNLFNVKDVGLVTSPFNNVDRLRSQGMYQSLETRSSYHEEMDELRTRYMPEIKSSIAKVIGINDHFFKFILEGHSNPVVNNHSKNFYLEQFSGKELVKI